MTDLFEHLTVHCLRLVANPDLALQVPSASLTFVSCSNGLYGRDDDTSDWLLTDKVASWAGTAADRGWRYLRQALERYDGPQSNYAYTKATLEAILGFDRLSPPPPWLIQSLQASPGRFPSISSTD